MSETVRTLSGETVKVQVALLLGLPVYRFARRYHIGGQGASFWEPVTDLTEPVPAGHLVSEPDDFVWRAALSGRMSEAARREWVEALVDLMGAGSHEDWRVRALAALDAPLVACLRAFLLRAERIRASLVPAAEKEANDSV